MLRCISVQFENAPVSVREKFAFPPHMRRELYARLKEMGGGVLLVTCNRTELYFFRPFAEGEALLCAAADAAAPFVRFAGESAVSRLFFLAAGLRSMLVGEDEILHQLKGAYLEAQSSGATKGADALFQAAIACGRKVRAQTKIGEFSCSVATLAANAVTAYVRGHGRVLLVGGSGMVGRSVLKNLVAAGHTVIATERTHLFEGVPQGVRTIAYSERYAALDGADAVVSCTASPHVVFSAAETVRALVTPKKRLFLDLAVPPDIDPALAGAEGCTLRNIDDFRAAAEENNAAKRAAALAAEAVVRQCLTEYAASETARMHADRVRRDGALRWLRKHDPAASSARIGQNADGEGEGEE